MKSIEWNYSLEIIAPKMLKQHKPYVSKLYKQNLLYPVAHSRTLARTHPIRPSLKIIVFLLDKKFT